MKNSEVKRQRSKKAVKLHKSASEIVLSAQVKCDEETVKLHKSASEVMLRISEVRHSRSEVFANLM